MCFTGFKRRARRISIWAIVFALMLTVISSNLILPLSAANMGSRTDTAGGVGEAISDVGEGMSEAISDVGEGMSEAISDVTDSSDDGNVNDTDGMIGNSDSGADKAPSTDTDKNDEKSNGGWIALAIAIVVIVAIVVLIIVLIPRRKDNE